MEAPAVPVAEEALQAARWGNTPPRKWEEEELDILAFELWQRASCPDTETDQDWVEAEAWCLAGCP